MVIAKIFAETCKQVFLKMDSKYYDLNYTYINLRLCHGDTTSILTARGSTLDIKIWRLKTSDSDIKVDPRTKKNKIFIMVVDPRYRYSNEAETANQYIYEAFNLEITLWSPWFISTYFNALMSSGSNWCGWRAIASIGL